MTIEEAIAKLNVLSSYDTAPEKREEYKQCINAINDTIQTMNIAIKTFIEESSTHFIVNDIIDIYNKRYKNYNEYLEEKKKANEAINYFNEKCLGNFKYCVEQPILSIEYFKCIVKRRTHEDARNSLS